MIQCDQVCSKQQVHVKGEHVPIVMTMTVYSKEFLSLHSKTLAFEKWI